MNYNIMSISNGNSLAYYLDFLADYYNIYFVAFSNLASINDHKVSMDVYRRMSNRSSLSRSYRNRCRWHRRYGS